MLVEGTISAPRLSELTVEKVVAEEDVSEELSPTVVEVSFPAESEVLLAEVEGAVGCVVDPESLPLERKVPDELVCDVVSVVL